MKECPNCGGEVTERWVEKRKLRQECYECPWRGKLRTPTRFKIKITKNVEVDQFGGWVYEAFDQYGHVFCYSESFSNEKTCTAEALKQIKQTSQVEGYGDCSAVIWPPRTKVKGKLIKCA